VGFDGPYVLYVAEGEATHLGGFEASVRHRSKGGAVLGAWIVEGANGDGLTIATEAQFDEDRGMYVGTYEIVGGTGRFSGATGGGDYAVFPPEREGDPSFLMEGTIAY
jgi:hypothetical protein